MQLVWPLACQGSAGQDKPSWGHFTQAHGLPIPAEPWECSCGEVKLGLTPLPLLCKSARLAPKNSTSTELQNKPGLAGGKRQSHKNPTNGLGCEAGEGL